MLQTLPEEILGIIYEQLNFYTKVNLAKTCRKLRDSLYSTVLYHDIRIPKKQANILMMRFRDRTLDGTRVRSCSINHYELKPKLFTQLPSIFPNLKELTFPYTHYEGMYPNDIEVVYELRNTLEVCGRYVGDCVLVLLPVYEFPHITQLAVNESCYQKSWKCLKNVPNLNSLTLYGFKIDFEFLEDLHLYAPNLKQLVMLDTYIYFNVLREPKKIEPAHYLLDFQILTTNYFYEQDSHVIHYIWLKYPNIKSLQISNTYGLYPTHPNEIFFEHLKQLVDRLDDFKTNFSLTEEGTTSTTHLTGRGFHMIFPCLSRLGHYKRRIRRMCLENITTLSFPINYIPYIYGTKNHFPHVKDLRLLGPRFPRRDSACIMLDALLFSYTGLETLDIRCEFTSVGVEVAVTHIYPCLRRLKLQVFEIQPETIDFIRSGLPNLTDCYLGTELKNSSFRLDLPEHTFHLLILNLLWKDNEGKRWKFLYKIKTEDGERKLKYLHRGADDVKVTEKKGIDFEYFSGGYIDIVCKRLLQLKHNNYSLL